MIVASSMRVMIDVRVAEKQADNTSQGRLPRPLRVADGRDVRASVFERPERSHRRDPAGSHWPLCDRTQAGRRRHGRRLRGARRSSRAHHRPEDAVGARQRRHGAAAPVARGQGGGERQPSEHLPDLRNRRGRRPAVHRDGAARRRSAGRAAATGTVERRRRRCRSVWACWPRSPRCTRAGSSIAT